MTHCLTSPLIVTSRSQLISSLLLSEPSNCPGSDERERRGSRIFSSVLSPPPSPPSLSLSTRHLCSVHTYQGVGDWNDEMFLFLLFWCDKIKIKNAQLPISGDYDAALAVLLTSNVRGFTVPKEIDFPRYNMKCSGENVILCGIFHAVSCFPLHFMLYRGNFNCFSNRIVRSRRTLPLH